MKFYDEICEGLQQVGEFKKMYHILDLNFDDY